MNSEQDDKHKERVQHWFDAIDKTGVNLSAWEEDFVRSVKEQFKRNGSLSNKQEDILERIYAEKTD